MTDATETVARVRMICGYCGSEDVLQDAWASWDFESQEWVLHDVMAGDFCQHCDGRTHIEEVPDGEVFVPEEPEEDEDDPDEDEEDC